MELSTLKIKEVMTPSPITIDEDTDLVTARKILHENKIRHLPVVHAGKLTGVLSERDTRLVTLLSDISKVAVSEVMTPNPVSVLEDAPVMDAVSRMAQRKYGCVIVTSSNNRIAGIFTGEDALRLLLLEREGKPGKPGKPEKPDDWLSRECDDDEDLEDIDCMH